MSYTTHAFSTQSKIRQIFRRIGISFSNNNPLPKAPADSDSLASTRIPDTPSMRMDGWVDVTIRQKMGGSFADGNMYFSSIRPKTTVRSTKTFRVAINFRDTARSETERLMNDRDDDLHARLHVRGELNWINHQKGPNPVINVDWFEICEGDGEP